ncbi:hypothetical protein QQ045_031147 [Rhodiola kirilowii]
MIVGISPSAAGAAEVMAQPQPVNMAAAGCGATKQQQKQCVHFQMPLHYPRYTRADYEVMPEWKLDCLLAQYGLPVRGDVEHKRKFAMGAFLWVL